MAPSPPQDPSPPQEPGAAPSPTAPRVAVAIIGDEILTGKFRDENSPWLIDRCRELGLALIRIVVLPDDLDVIAAEVGALSAACDWVFTTGGVGPTHDDMTMEGVARALGRTVERRPELVEVLQQRLKTQSEDALRMADVPQGAELWWDGEIRFPQVVAGNVVIFPGVPGLLRLKFDAVAHRFGGVPVHCQQLRTSQVESEIAGILRTAQARWPQVHIGSYPRYEEQPWHVIVILDGHDLPAIEACMAWLRGELAEGLLE
ncbi:MAG: competence/damage-inducible protein A [Alphaproteobacteria bacterium]|nr:competence/damage-inducible protein A [Alphaproteobacteria bacterium]